MSLIFFMLLVVVVLAVGVRILDGGSKIGLAVAVLLAALLGFRLVSQESTGPIVSIRALAADEGPAETVADADADTDTDTDADADTDTDADAKTDNQVETTATVTDADTDGQAASVGSSDVDSLEIEVVALPGKPIIPPRPEWVEAEPIEEGDSRIVVVSSGPQGHMGECQAALDAELERAVAGYIDEYLGQVYGDKFQASTFVSFPAEYIRDELVDSDKVYDERIQFSFGPMYQSHAQVAFSPDFRAILDGKRVHLDRQWQNIVVTGRLTAAALAFGLVLAMLVVVTGYFRLDTATRGFYTARLQFLATVAILAVIVAGALLARNVHWM